MDRFGITEIDEKTRCVWFYDDGYRTRGSYRLDTPEETRAAEDAELEMLESGAWVALGCIVQRLCECCSQWGDRDSLWGIIIAPDSGELERFARDNMDLT